MIDIIEKKRDGKELSKEEIDFWISGYVKGEIPDYQVSSLAMAIYFNGMSDKETTDLTLAMANSGDQVDLSGIDGFKVDKHSSGGVGDKTTLIVAPIVACLGGKVAKMSGRGLGFTGGTADKLEAIDGYNTIIPREDFINQVNRIGISLITQSGNLVPADKKLYSLRDVTATVESIPLIASSIMSKKIASGADGIVLDVKTGSGAFMKSFEDSKKLAEKMVAIGRLAGKKMSALITSMDVPLGINVGNSLEVIESIEVLQNKGPEDLREVSIRLAILMLCMTKDISEEEARKEIEEVLENGMAFNKFKELVAAQGGNVSWIDNTDLFSKASFELEIKAPRSGYIAKMDTAEIGKVACKLGAGRETKDEKIDFSAGLKILKKTSDYVEEGETIAILYTNKENAIEETKKEYLEALRFSDEKPEKLQLIYLQI